MIVKTNYRMRDWSVVYLEQGHPRIYHHETLQDNRKCMYEVSFLFTVYFPNVFGLTKTIVVTKITEIYVNRLVS